MNTLTEIAGNHIDLIENLAAVKGSAYADIVIALMNGANLHAAASDQLHPIIAKALQDYHFELIIDLGTAKGLTREQLEEAAQDARRLSADFHARLDKVARRGN